MGLRVYVRTFKESTRQQWKINDYLAAIGFVSLELCVRGFLILSYCGTAVQVAMDWSCAITPFSFFIVRTLQMPRREKISVVAILGLGILASVAALMRIVSYKYIDEIAYPNDHMRKRELSARALLTAMELIRRKTLLVAQGRLLFWSIFESSFAIIACSLPPLKKLFSSCLGRSASRSNLTPGSVSPPPRSGCAASTNLFPFV